MKDLGFCKWSRYGFQPSTVAETKNKQTNKKDEKKVGDSPAAPWGLQTLAGRSEERLESQMCGMLQSMGGTYQ